jgi:hypothetical protein
MPIFRYGEGSPLAAGVRHQILDDRPGWPSRTAARAAARTLVISASSERRWWRAAAVAAALLLAPAPQAVSAAGRLADQEPFAGQPGRVTAEAAAPSPADSQTANNLTDSDPDVDGVSRTLARYAVALTNMNADEAVKAWPSADHRALLDAFKSLESNRVAFDACAIEIGVAGSAIATCRATARYVQKIGPRTPRVSSQQWRFAMSKAGSEWQIQSATTIEDR